MHGDIALQIEHEKQIAGQIRRVQRSGKLKLTLLSTGLDDVVLHPCVCLPTPRETWN